MAIYAILHLAFEECLLLVRQGWHASTCDLDPNDWVGSLTQFRLFTTLTKDLLFFLRLDEVSRSISTAGRRNVFVTASHAHSLFYGVLIRISQVEVDVHLCKVAVQVIWSRH